MNPSSQTQYETSSKNNATEQKTRTETNYTEQSKSTPRSKESHLGITIRGCGPACGRTANPDAAPGRSATGCMIVLGWSGC